jgi:UDP-N-acetylglucosamine 2-epimerase
MIHFFVGTKAQLIKLAPVMIELQSRGIPYRYVDSGQHAALSRSLRKVFPIAEPDILLHDREKDIATVSAAVAWYLRHVASCALHRRWLREEVFPGGGICLIHGDTLSTLLGMQMARAAGLDVGHVEAGLRSFHIWEPFPEELIRIRCMRRAQLLFAPSPTAAENLRAMRVRGQVIEVPGNTVVDAMRLVDADLHTANLPAPPYVLATCHRFETISRRERLGQVVGLLNRAARRWPVIFVGHEPTYRYLDKFGLAGSLDPEIDRRGMQDYDQFVALLKGAKLVLTDGGSIQEECGYLNKPCLILRRATERPDGIGTSARLWGFDDAVAEEFFDWAESAPPLAASPLPRPSKAIVDALVEAGYADKALLA